MIPDMPETADRDGAPQETFMRHLKAGSFQLQECARCKRPFHYPRSICPVCGGTDLAWVEMSGTGVVYSATTVRRKPERGGDYNISLIDLAEGPRMMSRVEGPAPDAVKIGTPVKAHIATEGETPIVIFVVAVAEARA